MESPPLLVCFVSTIFAERGGGGGGGEGEQKVSNSCRKKLVNFQASNLNA